MTKAAVLRVLSRPLVVEDLEVPPPTEGQVLVRMVASGVCGSQLLEARGMRGEDPFLPHLLGHEGAGVAEEVGRGVSRVKRGDPVVLTWIRGPGLQGGPVRYEDPRGGTVNAGPIATFAERVVVSEDRVTPIRRDMPLDLAALLGCAVATGVGAVLNTARVGRGDRVAVFGAGGIGLNAIQAAVLAGAARIIAVDVHDHKLDRARAFGATDVVNAGATDAVAAILAMTGGKGVDCAIESAGRRASMEASFRAVRVGGGRAVLVGNLPAGESISIDPLELIRGREILGSWGGATDPARDLPRYADLFMEGKLKLAELVSHRFRLDQVNEALGAMERGEVARAIIEFG